MEKQADDDQFCANMEDLPQCTALSMGRKGHMRFKPLDFDGFSGSDTSILKNKLVRTTLQPC